eukprot:6190533-Pleurochrysis_carterae.AAC.2
MTARFCLVLHSSLRPAERSCRVCFKCLQHTGHPRERYGCRAQSIERPAGVNGRRGLRGVVTRQQD